MLSYYQLWFQRVRLPWTGVLIHTERFLSSFIITHFSICLPRSYSRLTECFVKHFVGWNDQKQIKMSFNLFLTEVDYGFFCLRVWLGKSRPSRLEFAVTGSLCLRKDFWDRHGANIATRQNEIYGERLFRRPKKRFWWEIIAFFAAVL